MACDVKCATCTGASFDKCQTCKDPYLLTGTSCVETCPTATYGSVGRCNDCNKACTSCSGSAISECSACVRGFYVSNTTCTQCQLGCDQCTSSTSCQDCTEGYFKNNIGLCMQCDSKCVGCTGLTNKDCKACASGFYKDGNTCDNKCPAGKFRTQNPTNASLLICDNCQEPCEECALAATSCTRCMNDSFYLNKKSKKCDACSVSLPGCLNCQSEDICLICRDGTFLSEDKCINCDASCATCDNTNTCLTCPETLFFHKDTCIDACPAAHKSDTQLMTCPEQCAPGQYIMGE